MEFYFVVTGMRNKMEMEAVKELRPPNLMLSYHYFKNVDLGDFIKFIGYKPNIYLDSGAFSAYTSGKPIDFKKYVAYIKHNEKYVKRYFCLDALGDNQKSYERWEEMRGMGLKPIPVFHYMGDETILQKYIDAGEPLIALGGTVPIKSKKDVAEWVRMISWQYPANYHLLGSQHKTILDHCDIQSADASTWAMAAIFGRPEHIGGRDTAARILRAKYNMKKAMEWMPGK